MARDWELIPTAGIRTKSEANALIAETSKNFDRARRDAELASFEIEERPHDAPSLRHFERTLARGQDVFVASLFQGYAPDTDLDNVRNRVIGILLGLIVTGLVFQYIWPERAQIARRTAQ